jgi:hypothetical protein
MNDIQGLTLGGETALLVNSAKYLQDFYVNKNAIFTKHFLIRWQFWKLMGTSIVFQDTDDPTYADKRKTLSGAFFKSKLIGMTETIKAVTYK